MIKGNVWHVVIALICISFFIMSCKDGNKAITASEPKIESTQQIKFSEIDLLGSWIDQTPELLKYRQGFTLFEGGKAKEINTATLVYNSWLFDAPNNLLILSGTSEGNSGIKDPFVDSLTIVSLDNTTLKVAKMVNNLHS